MQLDMSLTEHKSELDQKIIFFEGDQKKKHLELQQKNKLVRKKYPAETNQRLAKEIIPNVLVLFIFVNCPVRM